MVVPGIYLLGWLRGKENKTSFPVWSSGRGTAVYLSLWYSFQVAYLP